VGNGSIPSVFGSDGVSAKRATRDVALYAALVVNSICSRIEGSSFPGLFTRVEIGHIRIGSDGKGVIRSRGPGSSLSQRVYSSGLRMSGMRSWISETGSLASVVIIANVRIHSPEARPFQFSHQPADGKRSAVLHGNGIRLLSLLAFDRFPFKEVVDRYDAAAPAIGFRKRRQSFYRLALGIDRLSPAVRVLAPVRNKPPAQWVE
jgi:hypothetical protein